MTDNEKIDPQELRAKFRKDLIQRLFAIAISIGMATALADMAWVEKRRAPNLQEYQQFAILAAAMMATVLSWDGYLLSITKRPLMGWPRFTIDILLVFIYMFLIMTSDHPNWWIRIHALTYILYSFWDFLSVREHVTKYYEKPSKKSSVLDVYVAGFRDRPHVSKGPIITLIWAVYFIVLGWFAPDGLENRVFVTAILVIIGLALYRQDKGKQHTMARRLLTVAALTTASLAYTFYVSNCINDQALWELVGPYIGSASQPA
jgi:hypothetical protein